MSMSQDTVIGVVGAGTMGAGIAQVAAAAGHSVLLFDAVEGAAAAGLERSAKGLSRLVERGKMEAEVRDALLARVRPCGELRELAPAGVVIEAIVEQLEAKRELFKQLEALCGPDAILATNTSSISVTSIGAQLGRPQRLVGMHFFNPAPVMRLVEIVSGLETSPAVAEQAFALAEAWGKVAVRARSTPGFIVNRVARPFYAEALRIFEEGGADIATIDAVMRESGGFRMGPFELMDLIGNDINYAVTCSVFDAYNQDPRFRPSLAQLELLNAGRLGRKSGRGWYDYGAGAEQPEPRTAFPTPIPELVGLCGRVEPAATLAAMARAAGIQVEELPGNGYLEMAGVELHLSDGRSATERAAASGHAKTVVYDLAGDYRKAGRIAIAAAAQGPEHEVLPVCGFFQALGKSVSVIDDIPGMIVLRTVAMLANEAGDAVGQRVASPAGVDQAMRFGVNYPKGPLAWADELGLETVVTVLDHLAAHYGEDRYRVSSWLRRRLAAGRACHD